MLSSAYSLEVGKMKALPIPYNTHTRASFRRLQFCFEHKSIPTTHKLVIAGASPIVISLSCMVFGGLEVLSPWDVIAQNKTTSLYHLLS